MFISKKEKNSMLNRIAELERLVAEHEQLPDKIGNLTLYVEECENKIKSLNDRIKNLENKMKKAKKND